MKENPSWNPPERYFTWEEVSWMTGIAIEHLTAIYRQYALDEAIYSPLPPVIDLSTLALITRDFTAASRPPAA